jgi:hypothetical protein
MLEGRCEELIFLPKGLTLSAWRRRRRRRRLTFCLKG